MGAASTTCCAARGEQHEADGSAPPRPAEEVAQKVCEAPLGADDPPKESESAAEAAQAGSQIEAKDSSTSATVEAAAEGAAASATANVEAGVDVSGTSPCEGNAAASHEAAVTEEKAEAKTSATVGDGDDPVSAPEQTPETLPTGTSAAEQEEQNKASPKVASKAKTSAKGKATKSKDAKKKDEVVKPDAAPKQEAVQEEIPGPFEGHFLHPKFPKGKIPMLLKFDTPKQASWTTGKKTFKLTTVEIDGDKFHLSDGLTTAKGARDAKGNIKGEVLQEGEPGGSFVLKLVKKK